MSQIEAVFVEDPSTHPMLLKQTVTRKTSASEIQELEETVTTNAFVHAGIRHFIGSVIFASL